MGGRYLFDTEEQAADYEDFVLHRYVLDGVQFVDRAYFKDMGDALARLREAVPSVADTGLAVTTRYFSVEGMVSYGPARLAAHALVRREPVTLEVLWMKEAG